MEQNFQSFTNQQLFYKQTLTFVEVLDAGVVERLRHDFLQAVFAASAAGVHLHVAEAQLLQQQANPQIQTGSATRACWLDASVCPPTDLTDQGSCGGLPHPWRPREQSSFVS